MAWRWSSAVAGYDQENLGRRRGSYRAVPCRSRWGTIAPDRPSQSSTAGWARWWYSTAAGAFPPYIAWFVATDGRGRGAGPCAWLCGEERLSRETPCLSPRRSCLGRWAGGRSSAGLGRSGATWSHPGTSSTSWLRGSSGWLMSGGRSGRRMSPPRWPTPALPGRQMPSLARSQTARGSRRPCGRSGRGGRGTPSRSSVDSNRPAHPPGPSTATPSSARSAREASVAPWSADPATYSAGGLQAPWTSRPPPAYRWGPETAPWSGWSSGSGQTDASCATRSGGSRSVSAAGHRAWPRFRRRHAGVRAQTCSARKRYRRAQWRPLWWWRLGRDCLMKMPASCRHATAGPSPQLRGHGRRQSVLPGFPRQESGAVAENLGEGRLYTHRRQSPILHSGCMAFRGCSAPFSACTGSRT